MLENSSLYDTNSVQFGQDRFKCPRFLTFSSTVFRISKSSNLDNSSLICWLFIRLTSVPPSCRTIFKPFDRPSGRTICCSTPLNIIFLITGCLPPGRTFMFYTLSASSVHFLWDGALSNRNKKKVFASDMSMALYKEFFTVEMGIFRHF